MTVGKLIQLFFSYKINNKNVSYEMFKMCVANCKIIPYLKIIVWFVVINTII